MNINNQIQLIKIIELEKCYSKEYLNLYIYITKKAYTINNAINMFNKAIAFKDFKKAKRVSEYLKMFKGQKIDGKYKEDLFFNIYVNSLFCRIKIIDN